MKEKNAQLLLFIAVFFITQCTNAGFVGESKKSKKQVQQSIPPKGDITSTEDITQEEPVGEIPMEGPITEPDQDESDPEPPLDPPDEQDPPEMDNNQAPYFISQPITSHSYYQASGDQLILKSEVRDFNMAHVDFESYTSDSVVKGLVAPGLSSEGVPVFTGIPGQVVTSSESFSQWYKDVEGVNQTLNFNIPLQKIEGKRVYEYYSDAFFPIDNEGYGNEGNVHNYHFTLKVETEFTYLGGESFTFIGDDDLWVFIDGKLVIDLGGMHQEAEDTIDLDSLNLEIGKKYDFALFFAERKLTESNFKIETTIALESNQTYIYQALATDPDNETLAYSLVKSPENMVIDEKTGLVSWNPEANDLGDHQISIKVEDPKGKYDLQEFTLKILNK
ncbi:MAG: fibro-slime domain-containing protein [Oligoflexales bacterium]